MSDLPVLGAALIVDTLETHRTLMLDKPRDLELQDFCSAEVLNGDWTPLVERAKKLLDGHQGRLGIHGPFWGFSISAADVDIREVVKKRLLQGLEVCEALGGTQMVLHSPYSTWDYNNLDLYANARARKIEVCHLTMRRIFAPLAAPAAASGAILVFLTAYNEVTVSALLWSTGNETIGTTIFNYEDGGYTTLAAAMKV